MQEYLNTRKASYDTPRLTLNSKRFSFGYSYYLLMTMSSGDNTNSWSTIPFIINGKDVTSKASFPVNNPASSEKLWSGSSASISDATGAVEAAQAAFASWSQTKPSFRRNILFRAADLFISRKEELFAYQAQETGAGRQFMEINIQATAQILRDIGGRIEAAVEGSVPATAEQGSHAIVVKEPYGVVLAIAPWYVMKTSRIWTEN